MLNKENRKKHAYLLLIHKNSYVLDSLLQTIDYPLNDIYIHVDSKSKDFDFNRLYSNIKHSNIYVLEDRINTIWGAFSLVKAELSLLKAATSNDNYMYYHLLSGQDLPLKSQEEIHNQFALNPSVEYLSYENYSENEFEKWGIYKRVSVNHYLREYRNRYKNQLLNKTITCIDQLISAIEKYVLKRNRLKKYNIPLSFGSQWFSLTHNCIMYILSKEETITKWFRYSSLCDELAFQTIIKDSPFYNKTTFNRRKLAFNRDGDTSGKHPYIWKNKDYEELMSSDCLFARKFDDTIDKEIIDRIVKNIKY